MSSRPSREPSPSNSPKPVRSQDTSVNIESSSQQSTTSPDHRQHFAETPQPTTGHFSQSTINLPGSSAPLIIITTGSPESLNTTEESQAPESSRQSRSLVSRHQRSGNSFSQSPRRSTTPYARPRFQSQPRENFRSTVPTMSSASSSPGNTSTSGPSGSTTSGSIPGYAPFPYPMPPKQGGSGK
jgi:hypothetical protein